MEVPRPNWFDDSLHKLLAGENLTAATTTAAVRDLIAGRIDGPLAAAFLTAMRIKGESSEEIAAAALVLREQMIRLVPVSGPVLDTCGTGGDSTGTFNISTATAFVVAAAGVPVVKHGGCAVSSRSGSADVLRELGVDIDQGPEWLQRCLDRLGFTFCYAPQFHLGMKQIAAIRRQLGFRTIFNLLGPLANPASADFQLMGVGNPKLLDSLAGAIARLGIRRAVLVSGYDGLDEVTLSAKTRVRLVEGDAFTSLEWSEEDFGLKPVILEDLRAADSVESARMIREILANRDTAAKRVVLANAAAALWTAEAVATLPDGVARAEEVLKNGAAEALLAQVAAMK